MVNSYEQLLLGVGEKVKVQEGVSIHDSLDWLATELDGWGTISALGEAMLRSRAGGLSAKPSRKKDATTLSKSRSKSLATIGRPPKGLMLLL